MAAVTPTVIAVPEAVVPAAVTPETDERTPTTNNGSRDPPQGPGRLASKGPTVSQMSRKISICAPTEFRRSASSS